MIATIRSLLDAFGIVPFDWHAVRRDADEQLAQELTKSERDAAEEDAA